MSAIMSTCGNYRYILSRNIPSQPFPRPRVLFVMLNPSTADAERDDPTIRRCMGFARRWGHEGLYVANLYAYRATSPSDLWQAEDPVGPNNNLHIINLLVTRGDVVCAWGAHAKKDRVAEFISMAKKANVRLWCLGTTKANAPRHPLYVKADQELMRWEG